MANKMSCSNCQASIEERGRFCTNCGEEIQVQKEEPSSETIESKDAALIYEKIYCTECGTETTAEFSFCPACGNPLKETIKAEDPIKGKVEEATKNTSSKKKHRIKRAIVVAILIVLMLAGTGTFLYWSRNSIGKPYVMYLKDSEIQFTYLPKVNPFELTSKLFANGESEDINPIGMPYFDYPSLVLFSDNERFIFYPDRDDDNGATYYWRDMKKDQTKSSEGVKVDSNIHTEYLALSRDGLKFFYLKGEDNKLYIYDRKAQETEKLDDNVSKFYVSDTGDYLIYEISVDGESAVYEMYLEGTEGNKEKIDNNALIEATFPNSKTVFYRKDNNLYIKEMDKEEEKIASDIASIVQVVGENAVYYLKRNEFTINLSDYVIDDMADGDQEIKEPAESTLIPEPVYPNREDFTERKWISSYWGNEYNEDLAEWGYYEEQVDYDSFNEAEAEYNREHEKWLAEKERYEEAYALEREAYDSKLLRDELRDELRSDENAITVNIYSLYYWHQGVETEVASDVVLNSYIDNHLIATSSKVPIVIYQKYVQSDLGELKFSELMEDHNNYLEVIYDIQNRISSSRIQMNEFYMAVENLEYPMEYQDLKFIKITDSGMVYFLTDYDEEKEEGTLMSVNVSEGMVEEATIVEEEVSNYYLSNIGNMIYTIHDQVELYAGNKLVESDMSEGTLYPGKGNNTVLYYTDFKDERGGTLYYLKGDKKVRIADDVMAFLEVEEDAVVYLTDYDSSRREGTLKLYLGDKKTIEIDRDVEELCSQYPQLLWKY